MHQKRTKPILFLVATLFGTVLWHSLRETSVALVIEGGAEHLADVLGVPRPQMISAAFPFLIALALIGAVAWISYSLGERDRALKPEMEFVFSHTDHRFVKGRQNRTAFFFVGLRIRAHRTIDSPSVLAAKGPFTDRVIVGAHPQHGRSPPADYVVIYQGGALDPTVMETIGLFELPDYEHLNVTENDDFMRHRHTFLLEARGRDAKPATAEFLYDPQTTPMIRRLS